jgi:hypothetical protein
VQRAVLAALAARRAHGVKNEGIGHGYKVRLMSSFMISLVPP